MEQINFDIIHAIKKHKFQEACQRIEREIKKKQILP